MIASQLMQVVDEIESEASEDYVGLWVIVREFRSRLSGLDTEDPRLMVALACGALQARGVALGQFTPAGEFGFRPRSTAIYRMLVEWCDLGRDPDIGEVAWFGRFATGE